MNTVKWTMKLREGDIDVITESARSSKMTIEQYQNWYHFEENQSFLLTGRGEGCIK